TLSLGVVLGNLFDTVTLCLCFGIFESNIQWNIRVERVILRCCHLFTIASIEWDRDSAIGTNKFAQFKISSNIILIEIFLAAFVDTLVDTPKSCSACPTGKRYRTQIG